MVAPAALALFAVVGLVMTQRSLAVALGAVIVVMIVGTVLAWGRTTGWPLALSLALPVAATVALGHAQSSNLAWMGLCVAAGWVALASSLPVVVTATSAIVLTLVAEWAQQPEEPGWAAWLVGTGFTAIAFTFARQLRLTVDQLREAQHQLAERSRAEERTRIAAEVHDVIGHALTISLLHISSARLALDEDPEEARRAIEEAERLTRDSLEEVRCTVGLIRTDATSQSTPLPTAEQIPQLVESFRRAGAAVELTITGKLDKLGPTRGLAAYRIVQEALTNATRHAAGELVDVLVSVGDTKTTVLVRNGGASDPAAVVPGSGLRGMHERAESVGGHLRVGAHHEAEPHTWLVEAVLPT